MEKEEHIKLFQNKLIKQEGILFLLLFLPIFLYSSFIGNDYTWEEEYSSNTSYLNLEISQNSYLKFSYTYTKFPSNGNSSTYLIGADYSFSDTLSLGLDYSVYYGEDEYKINTIELSSNVCIPDIKLFDIFFNVDILFSSHSKPIEKRIAKLNQTGVSIGTSFQFHNLPKLKLSYTNYNYDKDLQKAKSEIAKLNNQKLYGVFSILSGYPSSSFSVGTEYEIFFLTISFTYSRINFALYEDYSNSYSFLLGMNLFDILYLNLGYNFYIDSNNKYNYYLIGVSYSL